VQGVNAEQQPGHGQEGEVIKPELCGREPMLLPLQDIGEGM
jgi:hypothetical protein